jgi:type II secretory pathway component PulF
VVVIVVTPMSFVVCRQANVFQKVQEIVQEDIIAAIIHPGILVAVLISAVIPVRVVVLPVIAAALGGDVAVCLPAVLPVSLVVMPLKASAVHLNIVILTAVTAVHLNVQFLV